MWDRNVVARRHATRAVRHASGLRNASDFTRSRRVVGCAYGPYPGRTAAESHTARPLYGRAFMTQAAEAPSSKRDVRQENQRDAKTHDDVVRLLSSDELAEASDFYDAAPCTD